MSLLIAAYLGFALISFGHDKILHFSVFAILTGEFYFMFNIQRPWKITFIFMTLGASIALEFVQHLVNPKRVFDPEDIYYNCFGSLLSLIFCVLTQRFWIRQRSRNDLETGDTDYVYVNLQDIET